MYLQIFTKSIASTYRSVRAVISKAPPRCILRQKQSISHSLPSQISDVLLSALLPLLFSLHILLISMGL